MARRSTGKRTRFEVFKRDHFTCQYCGAQPPAVVLVIDHIDPVKFDGPHTIDNFLTACEACNQGKADKLLGDRAVRPDADLLYLQTQQEIAELQRYRAALAEKEAVLAAVVSDLQDVWCAVGGLDWAPSESVIRYLIEQYGSSVAEDALRNVATKVAGDYPKTRGNKWIGYLYATGRTMAIEAGE